MMDFLLLIFNGALNCVVLMMALKSQAPIYDANYWIGLGLAFITGYGLSIIRDIRKSNFTIKNSIIKFFASMFLCYLAYLAKADIFPNLRLEWFIAGVSFGSLYIVDALEKIFSLGVPKAAQLLLHNLSSYMDKNKTREEDNL